MTRESRIDPHTGTVVHIVADRQNRPNLPADGCPFCVGGLEAPEPYRVRSFPNRWPALGPGQCEVVLYTADHSSSFSRLDPAHARDVIDLWASRTTALREMPTGEHVLVFENRGAEVGATISHPHGQIYAFDHVPRRPLTELRAGWAPERDPGARLVTDNDMWTAWTEHASVHPVSVRVAPRERVADLPGLSPELRDSLSHMLPSILRSLDESFGAPTPYMMWINQSPRDASQFPDAWLNLQIVSPWRAPGVARYIAAAEIATEEYFNPVDPADVASRLRQGI